MAMLAKAAGAAPLLPPHELGDPQLPFVSPRRGRNNAPPMFATISSLVFLCPQAPMQPTPPPAQNHHRTVTREQLVDLGLTPAWLAEFDRIGANQERPQPPWRPGGQVISSPAHLCEVELARDAVDRAAMGRAMPTHLFLWSVRPPERPYLTRVGGVPWRPAKRPWPQTPDGKAHTFVGQFCFADSREIVGRDLPGDVLLVFVADFGSPMTGEGIVLEWSPLQLDEPFREEQVPRQWLSVPRYSGVLYETHDYPDGGDAVAKALGKFRAGYLIDTTQATKIGRAVHFIQGDPRLPGEELLCCLSSIHLPEAAFAGPRRDAARWPLLDLERHAATPPRDDAEFGTEQMMFHDVGAMFFLIDGAGRVRATGASY